jgi:AcrR family transcriptional regulator
MDGTLLDISHYIERVTSTPRSTRRAEYAAATHQAILDAARGLFGERGYFATRVEDIASVARVAAPTVYAAGGKPGLLRELMDAWCSAPVIGDTYGRVQELSDGAEILRLTAAGVGQVRREWGDVMRVVLATAPHDPAVAEVLATATGLYRDGMRITAERLKAIGALRDRIGVAEAADVLWFYFGYSGYFTLVDDNGWTPERAQDWLGESAGKALLR